MTSHPRRTWQQHHVGHLLITVEVDPIAEDRSDQHDRGLADVTTQLVALAEKHRLPMTWAVNDPAHSAATSLVLRSAIDHELAILGDPSWLGPTAGRTRFARELARRVAQARASRVELVSLVPRVAAVVEDIDLVVKQGITAVSGVEPATGRRLPCPVPRALHYGVWELPVGERMPIPSAWFLGGRWTVFRQIRRIAHDAATFHLVLDAPALEGAGGAAVGAVGWLMGQIAELRNRGLLKVQTLGEAAARLSNVPAATPQRSILRAA